MEMVLDVPHSARSIKNIRLSAWTNPPKQLIWPGNKGSNPCISRVVAKYDYEYSRCGVCNIFLACEPLAGKRLVNITERKTKLDWACFIVRQSQGNTYSRKDNLGVIDHPKGATHDRVKGATGKGPFWVSDRVSV